VEFKIRQAGISDEAWLYALYCSTMRAHIEKTWGWVDEFQENGFKTNLHPAKFKIVVVNGEDVGAYLVNDVSDHYWLEMLLVAPEIQKCGLGTAIVSSLQHASTKGGKPLRLSVLKVNPAKAFYSRMGFHVYDEDDAFFKMAWTHDGGMQC